MAACAQELPDPFRAGTHKLSLSLFLQVSFPKVSRQAEGGAGGRPEASDPELAGPSPPLASESPPASQEPQGVLSLFLDAAARPFGTREIRYLMCMARIMLRSRSVNAGRRVVLRSESAASRAKSGVAKPGAASSEAVVSPAVQQPSRPRAPSRDPYAPLFIAIACLAVCRLPQQVCAALDIIEDELGRPPASDPVSLSLAYVIMGVLPIGSLGTSLEFSLPERAKIRALSLSADGWVPRMAAGGSSGPIAPSGATNAAKKASTAGAAAHTRRCSPLRASLRIPDVTAASGFSVPVSLTGDPDGTLPRDMLWRAKAEVRFSLRDGGVLPGARKPACCFEAKAPRRRLVESGAGHDCAMDFALALSTELIAGRLARKATPLVFRARVLAACERLVARGFCSAVLNNMRRLGRAADDLFLALQRMLWWIESATQEITPRDYREGDWGSEDDSTLDMAVRGTCFVNKTRVSSSVIRLVLLLVAPYSTVYVLRPMETPWDADEPGSLRLPAREKPRKPSRSETTPRGNDYFFAEAPMAGDLSLDFRPAERGWSPKHVINLQEESVALAEAKACPRRSGARRVWLGSRGRLWRERVRMASMESEGGLSESSAAVAGSGVSPASAAVGAGVGVGPSADANANAGTNASAGAAQHFPPALAQATSGPQALSPKSVLIDRPGESACNAERALNASSVASSAKDASGRLGRYLSHVPRHQDSSRQTRSAPPSLCSSFFHPSGSPAPSASVPPLALSPPPSQPPPPPRRMLPLRKLLALSTPSTEVLLSAQQRAMLDVARTGAWDVAKTEQQLPWGIDYLSLDLPERQNRELYPRWIHIAASDFLDLGLYLAERGLEVVTVCKVLSPYHVLVEECPCGSRCATSCSLRAAQLGKKVPVDIVRYASGWGVRTCCPVPRGALLGLLAGELLTFEQAWPRVAITNALGCNRAFYVHIPWNFWAAHQKEPENARKRNSEGALQTLVLDGGAVGNENIMIRQSSSPSADLRFVFWNSDVMPYPCLFVQRDLGPGEEVTLIRDARGGRNSG